MAKLGKFLLATAAIGTAAAAAYYYFKKKDAACTVSGENDEDYDDFSDDLDTEAQRNYVPLNLDSTAAQSTAEEMVFEEADTAVTETETVADAVEEFFDEDLDETTNA